MLYFSACPPCPFNFNNYFPCFFTRLECFKIKPDNNSFHLYLCYYKRLCKALFPEMFVKLYFLHFYSSRKYDRASLLI